MTAPAPETAGFALRADSSATWGAMGNDAPLTIASGGLEAGSAGVGAGLDGLRNMIEPPPETHGIAYGLTGVTDLPTRLEQALDAFEADSPLRARLGEEFVKLYLAVKRAEVAQARQQCTDYDGLDFGNRVDPWEVNEYFEFL